ncbi:MAG: hypothetical protein ACLP5H_11690, partial [Desulfomonilaceae bacterium]
TEIIDHILLLGHLCFPHYSGKVTIASILYLIRFSRKILGLHPMLVKENGLCGSLFRVFR